MLRGVRRLSVLWAKFFATYHDGQLHNSPECRNEGTVPLGYRIRSTFRLPPSRSYAEPRKACSIMLPMPLLAHSFLARRSSAKTAAWLVRPQFLICRIPFLPCGLMACRQYHQGLASPSTRYVANIFSFPPLLRCQIAPFRSGKVTKVDAPARFVGFVQFARVHAQIGHEESASRLEWNGDGISSGFDVLIHAYVAVVTSSTIQQSPTVTLRNDPAATVFHCSFDQGDPYRYHMQLTSVAFLLGANRFPL